MLSVKVLIPAGYRATARDVGGDKFDSDISTDGVMRKWACVGWGRNKRDWFDAGLVRGGSGGGGGHGGHGGGATTTTEPTVATRPTTSTTERPGTTTSTTAQPTSTTRPASTTTGPTSSTTTTIGSTSTTSRPQLTGIGGYVFLDADSNGLVDNGEASVAGARVELWEMPANRLVDTDTSRANGGVYGFGGIDSTKCYQLRVSPPSSSYSFSPIVFPMDAYAGRNKIGPDGLSQVFCPHGWDDTDVIFGVGLVYND